MATELLRHAVLQRLAGPGRTIAVIDVMLVTRSQERRGRRDRAAIHPKGLRAGSVLPTVVLRDEVNRTQTSPHRASAHYGAQHAGGAVDCDGQDGRLRERVAGLGATAAPGEAAAVAELVRWTDSRWASVPERWAVPAQGLCPCRRLLLGLILFGRLRYQAAAARTGLSAQIVSVLCLTALRQLRETTTRETEA